MPSANRCLRSMRGSLTSQHGARQVSPSTLAPRQRRTRQAVQRRVTVQAGQVVFSTAPSLPRPSRPGQLAVIVRPKVGRPKAVAARARSPYGSRSRAATGAVPPTFEPGRLRPVCRAASRRLVRLPEGRRIERARPLQALPGLPQALLDRRLGRPGDGRGARWTHLPGLRGRRARSLIRAAVLGPNGFEIGVFALGGLQQVPVEDPGRRVRVRGVAGA